MNKYILIPVMLFISACASQPVEKVITKEVPVEKIPLDLSMPKPFTWQDFEVIVVTENNFEEVIERLKTEGKSLSLIAFDEDGYAALTLNVNEMKRYMKEQKLIILEYKNYYENNNNN